MKTTTPLRRLVAGVGALALALSGAAAMGTNAFADVGPDQPGNPGEGSLTIHKIVGAEGDHGDGNVMNPVPEGEALDGAEFTVWRLGVPGDTECVALDLGNTDHWDLVPDGAAPTELEDVPFCLVDLDGTVGVTGSENNATGEYVFDGLPLGLYYVQETDAPAEIVSRTAPFYVAVPMPLNNDWIYDVHVYPKNQELEGPEKTINDDADQTGLVVGSTVEWTITQTVPALNADEEYTSASIWDALDEALSYEETVSVSVGGTELLASEYSVDEGAGNLVTWVLGNDVLADLVPGSEIEIKFTTTVNEVNEDGAIANLGENYGSEFNGGTTPGTTDPYTYWGELSIFKHDQAEAPLANATFQVFEADESGECAVEVPEGAPVATGTSDSTGIVQWEDKDPSDPLGLWVANTQSEDPTVSKVYCVYETVIPAGYSAVETMYEVEIAPGLTRETFDVENIQKEGPDLPLTGGAGTVALMTGGVLLFGAGVAVMVTARRRRIMEV